MHLTADLSGLRRARLPAATPARRPRGGLAASSVDQDRGPRVQGSERLASRARGGAGRTPARPAARSTRGLAATPARRFLTSSVSVDRDRRTAAAGPGGGAGRAQRRCAVRAVRSAERDPAGCRGVAPGCSSPTSNRRREPSARPPPGAAAAGREQSNPTELGATACLGSC